MRSEPKYGRFTVREWCRRVWPEQNETCSSGGLLLDNGKHFKAANRGLRFVSVVMVLERDGRSEEALVLRG